MEQKSPYITMRGEMHSSIICSENDVNMKSIFSQIWWCVITLINKFDAKVAKGTQPGGTGHSFDWRILSHYQGRTPWMLAGGLTIDTVTEAVRISGASAVDVSSGVESQRGKKDENKIHDFIRTAQIG